MLSKHFFLITEDDAFSMDQALMNYVKAGIKMGGEMEDEDASELLADLDKIQNLTDKALENIWNIMNLYRNPLPIFAFVFLLHLSILLAQRFKGKPAN